MIVSAAYKRKALLCLVMVFTVFATFFVPFSLAYLRWIVIKSPMTTTINFGDMVVHSKVTTTMGIFKQCTESGHISTCQKPFHDVDTINLVEGCERKASSYTARMNATGAMLIIAFLCLIPAAILSTLYCSSGIFDPPYGQPVVLMGQCVVITSREKGFQLRIVFTAAAMVLLLIAVCVYGNTMGSWIACGDHFCQGVTESIRRQQNSKVIASGLMVQEDITVNCGYGFSFGLIIMCLLATFASCLFICVEYFSKEYTEMGDGGKAVNENIPNDEKSQKTSQKDYPPLPHKPVSKEEGESVRDEPPTRNRDFTEVDEMQTKKQNEPFASPPPKGSTPSVTASRTVQKVPEGDDWEFNEDDQLFWSVSKQLYFDGNSGHFYDPVEDQWFNPEKREWYTL